MIIVYVYMVLFMFVLCISCDFICVYCVCISLQQDASMKKVLQFLTSHVPELQPGDPRKLGVSEKKRSR